MLNYQQRTNPYAHQFFHFGKFRLDLNSFRKNCKNPVPESLYPSRYRTGLAPHWCRRTGAVCAQPAGQDLSQLRFCLRPAG